MFAKENHAAPVKLGGKKLRSARGLSNDVSGVNRVRGADGDVPAFSKVQHFILEHGLIGNVGDPDQKTRHILGDLRAFKA